MNTRMVLWATLLLIKKLTLAQTKSLYLVDSLTKIPIQAATVQNKNLSFYQISDENGFIDLTTLLQSDTTIRISKIGFQPKTILLSSLVFDNKKTIIYLSQKISSLQEVTIQASSANNIFIPISNLDIHLRPINNAQEILRMIPGLFIGQHAGGGKAEQIFLRGFDLDHGTDINITVDGMPVNMVSHAHGQGYADLHFVIPEFIEKVHFNKGPYSADKGNFTTAGFVELKTKDYLENNFIKLESGQYSTFRGIVGINLLQPNNNIRNQSLYVGGEGYFTRGYFESAQNLSRLNGIIKYHKKIRHNTLTTTATAFISQWNASGQIPNRAIESGRVGWYGAIDNTEGGHTSRYNLNTEVLTHLKNGAILLNQVYYTKYDFELYSNFTFYKEDPVNGDQIRQKENRNLFGYNSTYENKYLIGKFKNTTKAGIQIRYDNVSNIELMRTKNRTINTKQMMLGDINELNVVTYYSHNIAVHDKLNITGTLRLDYFVTKYNDKVGSQIFTTNSIIICPKINFNYQVNNKIQLYLYNGKGFHSNDIRVAVQKDSKKVLPPAYGSDLGGIFKIGKKLIVQSAIWYLWLDQEFIYVGDEGIVEAGEQTQRFGLDISARYELAKNWYADIDISLANPRTLYTVSSKNYVPLAPRFTSVGGLNYRKKNGWNGSVHYRYMGDRPANENNSVIAKGYFIIDGTINYTKKKWEIGVSIQNILNHKWKETQFDTESQLKTETTPVSEIHFTPGTPFFTTLSLTINL